MTIPACNNPGYWGGNAVCYPNCGQIVSLAGALPCQQVFNPSNPTGELGCAYTYVPYADNISYNVPFGTVIAKNAGSVMTPGVYMAPGTPPHTFGGPLPASDQSINVNQNDTGITKVQYTYAVSQSAYLRAYGYSFYSDWYLTDPMLGACASLCGQTFGSAQYQLITHTSGGALDFQDQLNDQNLVTVNGNYTTAGVIRFNNNSAYAGCTPGGFAFPNNCSPIGYMSQNAVGGYTCYGYQDNNPSSHKFGYSVPCLSSSYYDVAQGTTVNPSWTSLAASGPTAFGAAGSPAAKAGATWDSLWSGNATGSYNSVRPRFANASLQDQFRPNDKFLINAAIRYDNFTYVMPDSESAADSFYAGMTANYTCVLASTNQVFTTPLSRARLLPRPHNTSTATATRRSLR